jgi:two-component sensor histidine kinase
VHPEDRDGVRAAFLAARDRPDGGDYSIEHRIIKRGGEQRWILAHGRVANDAAGEARLVVGTSLDITERKAAEERSTLLMGELAHRAKNGIAVVMAIVSQTARGQETVAGFQELILSRLQAMARSQDLVTASSGGPVSLGAVIDQALSPFGPGRVHVDPAIADVVILGEMAVGMGLLLHEMATNAVKYGALSDSRGRVSILRETTVDGRAAFAWHESGGPPVTLNKTQGFGTRLLQQVLRQLGGEVKFEFKPGGFWARAEFPTAR